MKVGFIIQARMRSTRLPGKVLLPIPLHGGKPIIQWIVDAVQKSKFDKKVILATSTDRENDPLIEYCRSNNIECFRGDEDDVLSRFIEILDGQRFDVVVRLTGDNPLVDIGILDQAIDFHLTQQNDYTLTEGLPTGMNFEVVSQSALLSLKNEQLTKADKEHVTFFIRNTEKFKKGSVKLNIDPMLSQARMTVDYPSDFLVLGTILSLIRDRPDFGINALKDLFAAYPWIFNVNTSNLQKREFLNVESEKEAAVGVLELLDMKRAAKLLKDLRS